MTDLSSHEFVLFESPYKHGVADYISITETAQKQLLENLLLHQRDLQQKYLGKLPNDKQLAGIKFTLPTSTCGAFTYNIEYAYLGVNLESGDDCLQLANGVKIFIDPKGSFMIFGMIMEYEDNGIEYGFQFKNPNEAGRCKCGTSFFT